MNAADWVILAVIGLSTLLSLLRGFTREAVSLAAWVAALLGARVLAPSLSVLLDGTVRNQELRELLAFTGLFAGILVIGMIIGWLLAESVRNSPLSVGDRLLGMAFGFARGILVVTVTVAIAGRWLAGESFWDGSRIIPHIVLFEGWTRDFAATLGGFVSG